MMALANCEAALKATAKLAAQVVQPVSLQVLSEGHWAQCYSLGGPMLLSWLLAH